MKVSSLMTSPAHTCEAAADLGAAARVMLEHNCGCLPVVDARGHVVGVITDRDVCTAVAARHQSPWHIPLREAMTRKVFSCAPGDDVAVALASMAKHHVRRLPVIDRKGHLHGVISLDDIARHAGTRQGQVLSDAVVRTLRTSAHPRHSAPKGVG